MLDATYSHDGTAIVTDSEDKSTRYVVFPDTDSESPAEYWEDTQLLRYATAYNDSDDTGAESNTGTMRAFLRVLDETGDDNRALTVAQRYARVYEPASSIDTYSFCGYSQSDWADIVIVHDGTQAGYALDAHELRSYFSEWAQYARGDVFAVMQEFRTVCDAGQEHWSTVNDQGIDSMTLGSIYADSAEQAVSYYLENN